MLGKRQGGTCSHDISYPLPCKRTRVGANPYEPSISNSITGYTSCNINYEASGCSPVGFAWQGCNAAVADAALPFVSQHCNYEIVQQQWLRSVQNSWEGYDNSSLAGLTHCEDMCNAAAQQQQPKLLSQLSSSSTQSSISIGETCFTAGRQENGPCIGTVNTSMSQIHQAAEFEWIAQQQCFAAREKYCTSPSLAQHHNSISPITLQLQQASHVHFEFTAAGHIGHIPIHSEQTARCQANNQLTVGNLCQLKGPSWHTPTSHCIVQYKTNNMQPVLERSRISSYNALPGSNNITCSYWDKEHVTPPLIVAQARAAQACYAPLMNHGYQQLKQQPNACIIQSAYSNVSEQQQHPTWSRSCVRQSIPLNASEFMGAAMRLLGFQESATLHLAIHCWARVESAIEAWSASRCMGLAIAGCSTPDMLRATALVTLWTASKLEEPRQQHAKSSVVAALLPPSLAPLGSRGVVVLETWVMKSLQWSPYSGFCL